MAFQNAKAWARARARAKAMARAWAKAKAMAMAMAKAKGQRPKAKGQIGQTKVSIKANGAMLACGVPRVRVGARVIAGNPLGCEITLLVLK